MKWPAKSRAWGFLLPLVGIALGLLLLDNAWRKSPPQRVEQGSGSKALAPGPSISAERARELALSFSGLGSFGVCQTPELITLGDENIPFLRKAINGTKAWRVRFTNMKFKPPYPRWDDKHTRDFEVLVSAESGLLVKISCKSAEPDPDLLPEPTVESAERQIHDGGRCETYAGFPKEPPGKSFMEALPAADGGAEHAENIEGLYVLWSPRGLPVRPAWVITLRGGIELIPWGCPADEVKISDRNYCRTIINSDTGDWMESMNSPGPESKVIWEGTKGK